MHRIRGMSGDPAGLTEAGLRWVAIIMFAAVTAVGVIPLNPSAPAAAAAAAVAVPVLSPPHLAADALRGRLTRAVA